jgi:hypothetical protein
LLPIKPRRSQATGLLTFTLYNNTYKKVYPSSFS